ncbi:MAG TPA: DUF2950 family protein [Terriglobales bacterium]|nr:DUF2950 family protein [Terriglobales bacterium]
MRRCVRSRPVCCTRVFEWPPASAASHWRFSPPARCLPPRAGRVPAKRRQQLVAPIAHYRNSGVMTFVVGANDVVDQQDLGPNAEALAHSIAAFDPATGWQRAEAPPQITAGAVH